MTSAKRFSFILMAVAMVLLIPFIAMQFSSEVQWSGTDFLVMGILLLGLATGIDLVIRKARNSTVRYLLIGALVLFFLFIWAELAVGIIGTPFAGT